MYKYMYIIDIGLIIYMLIIIYNICISLNSIQVIVLFVSNRKTIEMRIRNKLFFVKIDHDSRHKIRFAVLVFIH